MCIKFQNLNLNWSKFDSQKDHSYEFPTDRINRIRDVIKSIDGQIDDALEYDTSGK